jgi:hypothetical protein
METSPNATQVEGRNDRDIRFHHPGLVEPEERLSGTIFLSAHGAVADIPDLSALLLTWKRHLMRFKWREEMTGTFGFIILVCRTRGVALRY